MQTIEMDLARLVTSGLVTMEMAQSISAYPGEIQAQVSTLRSQAQAQATTASGQSAYVGFGVSAGEEIASNGANGDGAYQTNEAGAAGRAGTAG